MKSMPFKSVEAKLDYEEEESGVILRGLLLLLLRRLVWIIFSTCLFAVATYFYVHKLPNTYQASAVIEIESQEKNALSFKDDGGPDLKNPDVIETIIRRFGYRLLMERVATKMNLTTNRAFLGDSERIPAPISQVVNTLISQSKAEMLPGTRLINVSYTHPNPIVAQQIANALVNQFLAQETDDRHSTLEEQNSNLKKTADDLRKQVQLSESQMQDYKEKNESVSLEDRYNVVEEKLRAMNTDLSTARSDRLRLESDKGMIKNAADDPEKLLAIPSVSLDFQVKEARQKWLSQQADISALSQRYGRLHPKMIEAQAQLENSHQTFLSAVASSPERLEAVYEAALGKEQSLQSAVKDQEIALLKLEKIIIPYRALQREYESNRTLLAQVLQKMNESQLALGVIPVSFQIVENANPGKPLANKRMLYVLGAGFFGATLAISILAVFYLLNTSIKTVDEAENILGLPVLSGIPSMKRSPAPGNSLVLIDRADSPIAESFRTLRTALSFLDGVERKVILFTSAVASEGKSFTVANIAVALAQQGLRTLVIDADLRRPTCHRLLCKETQPTAGLGDFLTGKPLEITPTGIPNLSLIAAGGNVRNPAELLGPAKFRELLGSLADSFDRIIIDTAPVNLVSDTLNIAPCADLVCLVVRSNATPRKVVKRAIELLKRIHITPAGLVLGQLPQKNGFDYYHSYSAGSKYGTEQTYGADVQSSPIKSGRS